MRFIIFSAILTVCCLVFTGVAWAIWGRGGKGKESKK
jgi:hypothetical protein